MKKIQNKKIKTWKKWKKMEKKHTFRAQRFGVKALICTRKKGEQKYHII
jgi:hypothetical protein